MVYEGDGTDYEPTEAGTAGGTVRSLPAEQFDPMAIQNKIEKGGNFNSVQWYVFVGSRSCPKRSSRLTDPTYRYM
jgi:hypothetical protein